MDSVVLLDMLIRGVISPLPSSKNPADFSRRSLGTGPAARFTPIFRTLKMGVAPPRVTCLEPTDIVVAHFEHGIRGDESLGDQQFVCDLAEKYGLEFVTANGNLGVDASEADARTARYLFLRSEARKYGATIVTAHHADDVIETIAINLTRGTGWRGLAVMSGSEIYRPLLHTTKREILEYARAHQLEWREDSTNHIDAYLRNRIRKKLAGLDDDTKYQLLALRDTQVQAKALVDDIVMQFIDDSGKIERKIFSEIGITVADEIIRAWCVLLFGVAPARPARARILEAIRTYVPSKVHQSTDQIDVMVDKQFAYLNRRS